jgi:hypothetical protein
MVSQAKANGDEFTYIVAFGPPPHQTPSMRIAAAAQGVDLYAVWSLGMDRALAEVVGVGTRTACPGLLSQSVIALPSRGGAAALGRADSACEASCRAAPRCRSFVVRPNATAAAELGLSIEATRHWVCSLHGSRCTTPALDSSVRCNSEHQPPCADVRAFTLRQAAAQNVTFAASRATCFAATDVLGTAQGQVCSDAATGLLSVAATEAPMYLARVASGP